MNNNATVLKMMKLKLQKDAPEYVYMYQIFFFLQKQIIFDHKKRK